MALIHPSALVDPKAELADDVSVAAFAMIGPNVRIGAGTSIGPHAVVDGHTDLGCGNAVHAHATIGGAPQDKKYRGEPTRLVIGDNNTFRECVTINCGTVQDEGVTRVGDDNWVMAYVHIAHDCRIGSHTILANSVQLAGHVHVGDWAILGGITGVHQFVKIGAHAMTGAGTTLIQDLPTYVMATGNPAAPHGINSEGLRRRGFSADRIALLKKAYKLIYKGGLGLADAIAAVEQLAASESAVQAGAEQDVLALSRFLQGAQRGILR